MKKIWQTPVLEVLDVPATSSGKHPSKQEGLILKDNTWTYWLYVS